MSNAVPEPLVSTGTLATIGLGLVIGAFYLRYMWGALQRAVRTRDEADVGQDRYRFGLVGAVIAVFGSIVAIAVYGAGPAFLYVGPGLALLSAVAVAFCLRQEHRDE
jgi:small-conductance mechanosensitive channel